MNKLEKKRRLDEYFAKWHAYFTDLYSKKGIENGAPVPVLPQFQHSYSDIESDLELNIEQNKHKWSKK